MVVVRYTPDINQVIIVNFPRSNNWPLSKVQFAEFGELSFREKAARPKRRRWIFSPSSSVIASMSKEMLRWEVFKKRVSGFSGFQSSRKADQVKDLRNQLLLLQLGRNLISRKSFSSWIMQRNPSEPIEYVEYNQWLFHFTDQVGVNFRHGSYNFP